MKKKFIKALVSVITATTMLTGLSLTAFAADNTTTPRVIAAADETVVATSDPTQVYLTGGLTMVHDKYGSPDPQLINNGDGTWTLIMYEAQTVALGVNNPYTEYTAYYPCIDSATEPSVMYWDAEEQCWDITHQTVNPARSMNTWNEYGYSDIYNSVLIEGYDADDYVDVYNLQVAYTGDLGEAIGSNFFDGTDFPVTLGNTVTLAVYVLPTQEGAQTPTYTVDEQTSANWDPSRLDKGVVIGWKGIGFGQ